ncbi:MAG: Mur ligase domain-containing protein [Verrucomicrobia bacterium]|nr:Mur ligase domain-containing protein [Verrucomicrobiota bacterium]
MMSARPHCHLVGVAGVGMSAIAQALLDASYEVTGSDRDFDAGRALLVIDQLTRSGVRFVPQDGSGISTLTEALVVSTAIEQDNPDVKAALALGVPRRHRSEVLWMLASCRPCLAITGTSGKSTVTGMVGHILAETGHDPMVVNGAPLLNWKTESRVGNFRAGQGAISVIEADESDRSLLHFFPERAIITNASADHFDLPETEAIFTTFASQVKQDLVDAWREPGAYCPQSVECTAEGVSFSYADQRVKLPIMGAHNAFNAALAIEACLRIGVSASDAARALACFRGIHRRLERVGATRGVVVFDDYSHNPAKISAACLALRPHYVKLHVVWRPHGYGPLRNMMTDMVKAFGDHLRVGDPLHVLPVYDVGGTAERSVSHLDFVAACQAAGRSAAPCDDYAGTCAQLAGAVRPGDAVLVMGARDPFLPDLARQIRDKLNDYM